MSTKKWAGLHAYRTKAEDRALEKRFANAWAKANREVEQSTGGKSSRLSQLLAEDQHDTWRVSDRDRLVAGTVIQWLGSPIGEAWVRRVLREPNTTITDDELEFLASHEHASSADRKRMAAIVKKLKHGRT